MRGINFQTASLEIREKIITNPTSSIHSASVSGSDENLVVKYSKKDLLNLEVMVYQSIAPHKNIIRFYGHRQDECLVLKHAQFGDLQKKLESYHAFSKKVARRFFIEILDGLERIHSSGWVHNDLRLENILVTQDLSLKISDFDCASSTRLPIRGPHIAPERLQNQDLFCMESDIFSCGVMLFTMVVGKFPFRSAQRYDPFYQLLIRGPADRFWKAVGVFDEEFKDLVNRLLSLNPAQRPTVEEIKTHPWLQRSIATIEEVARLFN